MAIQLLPINLMVRLRGHRFLNMHVDIDQTLVKKYTFLMEAIAMTFCLLNVGLCLARRYWMTC